MGWDGDGDGWHAAQHGASRPANKGSLGFLGSKSPARHREVGKDKGASSGMAERRVTAPVSQVVTGMSTTTLAMPDHHIHILHHRQPPDPWDVPRVS